MHTICPWTNPPLPERDDQPRTIRARTHRKRKPRLAPTLKPQQMEDKSEAKTETEIEGETEAEKRKSVFSRSKSFAGNLLLATNEDGGVRIRRPSISLGLTRKAPEADKDEEAMPVGRSRRSSLIPALLRQGTTGKEEGADSSRNSKVMTRALTDHPHGAAEKGEKGVPSRPRRPSLVKALTSYGMFIPSPCKKIH